MSIGTGIAIAGIAVAIAMVIMVWIVMKNVPKD